jgi:hypothetical protein
MWVNEKQVIWNSRWYNNTGIFQNRRKDIERSADISVGKG